MNKHLACWFLVSSLVLAACGGDDSSSGQSPAARCDGTYQCSYGPGSKAEMEMKRDGQGVCHAGSFEVQDDGTIESDDSTFKLSGTTARFTICLAGETDPDQCIKCVDPGAPSGAGGQTGATSSSSKKKCSGSADSCSQGYPGHCSAIRGCSMQGHIRYDGSYESTCEGSSAPCSEMTSETSCESQGCTWK